MSLQTDLNVALLWNMESQRLKVVAARQLKLLAELVSRQSSVEGCRVLQNAMSIISRKFYLFAAIYIIVVFNVCAEEMNVQMLFEKALQNAQGVTNIELHAVDDLSIQRPKGNFSKTSQFLFISSGTMYRTECRSTSSNTNVIKFYETTYDGSLFSGFDVDRAYMTQGDKDEPGDNSINPLNPLIAHLMFLSKESDDCKECRLRFTDILSPSIASQANLTNIQKRDGFIQIIVQGGQIDGKSTSWRITLDPSSTEFTPRTIVRIVPEEAEITYSFNDYTNIENFWFPKTISYSVTAHQNVSPSDTLTGMTTVVSVTSPTNIPDSTFRLDEKQAKNYLEQ